MARLRRLISRVLALARPGAADREFDREIAAHLALLEDEYRRRGMSPDEARLAARRALGRLDQLKESHRDERSIVWLEDLRRDVPYAWRTFIKSPGFTTVAVVTLALGIGANTAIFTVVNTLLLRPLGYSAGADRLVRLMVSYPAASSPTGAPLRMPAALSAAELEEVRSQTQSLSHVGTAGTTMLDLVGHENARLQGAQVSASVFPMLGTPPLVGRAFTLEDEAADRNRVMILSHAAWQRFFRGDAAVVGRSLSVNSVLGPRTQTEYVVVGVMPAAFQFPTSATQFWIPPYVPSRPGQVARGPMLGRLNDGVALQAAADELAPMIRAIRELEPDVRVELVRERDEMVAPVRPALAVLTGAVAFVLLIACVNVANLLLARMLARQREVAVRAALGAGRGRLIRQALTETLLLSLLGGAAGIVLALGGVRLLRALATTLGRLDLSMTNAAVWGSPGAMVAFPRLHEIGLDLSVLMFTAATSILAGVLFGLAPAIRISILDPMQALREGMRIRTSNVGMRGVLVVAEISLATVLLIGGALMLHSFVKLSRVDAGYDPSNVLTFQIAVPASTYPNPRLRAVAEEIVMRLGALPRVTSAAYANQLPMVNLRDTAGGLWPTADPNRRPAPGGADARFVSRDYFEAMGIPIVAGRGFGESDTEGRPRVLLVNEALVRRDFAGVNPIGRVVYVGRDATPWEIVGVVANVRQFGLDREAEPQFFVDLRQWSGTGPLFPVGAYYVVRTVGDPETLIGDVRVLVAQLEPQAALFNVAPMDSLVATTISRPRMYAVLLTVFAVSGLALAVIGIYGVMSYMVTQRTRELGIRMALGADRRQVMSLVFRQGLAIAATGVVLGVVGAVAVARRLEGMLFGITPLDGTTYLAVAAGFALVALLASYIPARRATAVDPLAALRCE